MMRGSEFLLICIHHAGAGASSFTRLLGGENAVITEFAFGVTLVVCENDSLISPNVVLTAGHCLEVPSDSLGNLKPIYEIDTL